MPDKNEYEAIVLYLHHQNNYTVKKHLAMLRKHNNFPIIPVYCQDGGPCNPLDGATEVQKPYAVGHNWQNIDLIYRQWFIENPQFRAKRYIWLEADCRVNKPLIACYREAWKTSVAAHHILYPNKNPHWHVWDMHRHLVPEHLYPYLAGVAPINASMLSYEAMQAFAEADIPEGLFSEIRYPTILRHAGFNIAKIPSQRDTQNIYMSKSRSVEVTGDGIQHPVKSYRYVPNF